jgi:hypothetical protein
VAILIQPGVEAFGQLAIGLAIGRVVVVKGHAECGKVALVAGLDVGDEGFRGDPGLFGGQHDRGAVGVVGADEEGLVAAQAAGAHPHIGLDVADQVAQVQGAVGVGQGGTDECGAGHGDRAAGVADYRMGTARAFASETARIKAGPSWGQALRRCLIRAPRSGRGR